MMNKDKNNDKIRKIVKKGLTLSLCAVLAGGVAAGSFEGFSALTGETTVQAADKNDAKLTYAKSEKKADKDDAKKDDSKSDSKKSDTAKGSLDVSDIAAEALPSIVSITTKSVQEVQNYYGMYGMFGYAPQQQEQEVEGSGSGIIVGKNDDEYLIATNYHVVEGADTLSVAFADGTAAEATVKGFDEEKDLAVVAVSIDDIDSDTEDAISVAKIGSSDDLKVGEQVIAIGNALGYGQSVTTGIVSAKNRRMDSDNNTVTDGSTDDSSTDGVNLIQTDAAINPGNSGGALLNMDGEVVGINSAKLASTEVEGMGYAIAISDVTDILENLMNETARNKLDDEDHGVLGIKGQTVDSQAVQLYDIPSGVYVYQVMDGSAAEKAGLKEKSVITKFEGKTVSSIEQLISYLAYYEPGEEVELTVQVPGGSGYEENTVKVTLDKNTTDEDSDNKDGTKNSKKNSKDEESIEDAFGGSGDEDSEDQEEEGSEEDENPFIKYFMEQGLFR